MILRARFLVTMDGAPIENGAVAIEGEKVLAAGKWREISGAHVGEVVDLGERVLLPGLINAHCHLDYTCLRGKISPADSFAAWIRAINAAKSELQLRDYIASIDAGFAEAARFGTTTLLNLTAFPEVISRVHETARAWWCAELIDVRDPSRADALVEEARAQLRAAEHWALAPHAPFTASADLFRKCAAIAERDDVLLTTHLAESREEMEMLRESRGALFDFLQAIGRPMEDCGARSCLDFLRQRVQLDERWIVAHLNELSAADFETLRDAPKFHVVHCPRSHAYFGRDHFAFQKLRALGFNISLGTDSLASNDDLSLFAEMRAFRKRFPEIAPRALLAMVTTNPASALRQRDRLGVIKAGAFADLIALPFAGAKEQLIEEVVEFAGDVPWRMLRGTEATLRP